MVGTRAGFLGGEEVVEVTFAPETLAYEDLVAHAERADCARTVFTTGPAQLETAQELVGERARPAPGAIRPDGEPKYHLFTSPLRAIPMPELQAMRVNAALRRGDAEALLSPRQRELLAAIRAHPDAGWPNVVGRTDLRAAWAEVDAVRGALAGER